MIYNPLPWNVSLMKFINHSAGNYSILFTFLQVGVTDCHSLLKYDTYFCIISEVEFLRGTQ